MEQSEQYPMHGDHSKIGFIIGVAMQHYYHLELFIPETTVYLNLIHMYSFYLNLTYQHQQ